MATRIVSGVLNDDVEVIESAYNIKASSTAKYTDNDMIVCRAPLGNNHICGKRYRQLGSFVRHLEKPNVHGLRIGE